MRSTSPSLSTRLTTSSLGTAKIQSRARRIRKSTRKGKRSLRAFAAKSVVVQLNSVFPKKSKSGPIAGQAPSADGVGGRNHLVGPDCQHGASQLFFATA